jgi:8-oxo-dGTP pyrophosphatase MutT (NUDIX family)
MIPGETPEATAVREVQEETGVQVEIIELLGWYERTVAPHLTVVPTPSRYEAFQRM